MTKHGMRGFASGVIAASAIVALFYFQISPTTEASNEKSAPMTEESVEQYLNSHGEIAVDKETFNKWQKSEQEQASGSNTKDDQKTADNESKDTKTTTDSKDDSKSDSASSQENKTETPQVYKATVQVTQGMTTSDVAATLAAKHVIKDKYELINYVVSNKLEPYLQLGTFTLSSDMTIQQIASKITSR